MKERRIIGRHGTLATTWVEEATGVIVVRASQYGADLTINGSRRLRAALLANERLLERVRRTR